MITSKRGYFRDSGFGPIGLTSEIRDLYIWDPRISKFRFWDCFKYSDFGNRSLSAPITLCPPSHLGTWLCEGGGHGSEAVVSGKLV